ncbi:capsular associated protein [Flagelloscypha sp. PMI_526]|nr:capsular associated protein [Flagelloscypha sp. PMI_526]
MTLRSRSSTLSLLQSSAGASSGRFPSLLFVLVVFSVFVTLGLHAARPQSLRSYYPLAASTAHPITQLMDQAEVAYRTKLAGQSQSLAAAVAEYKRRYKRPPPKGFDKWYTFAQSNKVIMIDEYDGLMNDLAPFWNISGLEMRRRAHQAGSLPKVDLVRVKDGQLSTTAEVSGRAGGFKSMLEDFAHVLPDLEFAINAQAEGRVLLSWEFADNPDITLQDSSDCTPSTGEGTLWESWRRTCQPSKNARQLFSSLRNPFRTTLFPPRKHNFDFCGSPYAHYLQGHFFTDVRPFTKLYPIFSPAKAKGFSDIRIPRRYTYGWDPTADNMEVPWDEKSDKIYYRAIAMGGGTTPPGFSAQYQRHRFVRMASDESTSVNRSIVIADPPNSENYVSTSVPIGKLNEEIMDVGFSVFGDAHNYLGGADAMEEELNHASSEVLNRNWAYKYNVDLDGLGYSGRFMSLLASDSVPMKATVYEEFYSDWIQPWLHFIPLSQMYHEIYNVHGYFSGGTVSTLKAANSTVQDRPSEQWHPANGDARARRIARAGKVWHETMARKADLQAYVYRLCLEYARLSADDRDAMNYR